MKLTRIVLPELPPTVLGRFLMDAIRSRRQLLIRSRRQLLAENAFLRQQLIVANRSVKRPHLRRHERCLLALLAGIIPEWRDALLLVKPATLVRWHQQGFRLFWRAKSKPRCRQPRIGGDAARAGPGESCRSLFSAASTMTVGPQRDEAK